MLKRFSAIASAFNEMLVTQNNPTLNTPVTVVTDNILEETKSTKKIKLISSEYSVKKKGRALFSMENDEQKYFSMLSATTAL